MEFRRRMPLALCALAGFLAAAGGAQAQSNDPSFRVNNRSNATVNEIYVSSSAQGTWGPDHLGQNVLPPGQSYVIRLPMGQCINDIRVVYQGGQAAERRQVNTCNLTDFNLP
jgi:hypothetical protein